MKDHTLRNTLIGTVLGATVVALLTWLFPSIRNLIAALWSTVKSHTGIILDHISSNIEIPFWVLYLLLLFSLPFASRIVKWCIYRFLKGDIIPSPYSLYKKDIIFNVLWTWDYNSWNNPINIWCECPQCKTTLVYQHSNSPLIPEYISLFCETCNIEKYRSDGNVDYLKAKVARQIERKIKTAEWEEAVQEITTI